MTVKTRVKNIKGGQATSLKYYEDTPSSNVAIVKAGNGFTLIRVNSYIRDRLSGKAIKSTGYFVRHGKTEKYFTSKAEALGYIKLLPRVRTRKKIVRAKVK